MDEFEYSRLFDQAVAALESRQYVRAVSIADQLVAVRDDDAAVRNLRAQALLNLKSAGEALEEAQHAVRLDTGDAQARMLLGMAAWELGRLGLAQEAFERGIELSGHEPELLARYAWFLACERGSKLAAAASEEAIRADQQSALAWAALGLVQLRQHRLPVARESLRRALKIDPNDVHAQSIMLALLKEQGNDAQAEALVDVMGERPETEELIQEVRAESHRRRLEKALLEREAVRDSILAEPRDRRWFWLAAIAAVLIVFFLLLPRPGALAALLCVLIPLLMLLWWFWD
ncbi:MAG: tetratricopeptide repeat protein [Thermoguttaceae bacterium]|jgi:Tfp pilus assembly protein PilF|nr:tetratricopeptide repeat protein [Thermoguttaceae bacterium]